jgi:hypothetical protein
VSSIKSFNCATLVTGTIADATQVLTIRAPAALATNGMTGTCFFNNDDTFITFIDNATQRPIMAINDKSDVSDASALGNTTVTVHSSASVQSFYTYQYLQRYFQVTPTNNGPAKVRLYFTQAELNAIGTAVGYAVTASSLNLTRVPTANVSVNGSGVASINDISGATFHTPIASGSIASGITTSSHVFYADFIVPGFSYLFLHPQSTILPISLLNFGAKFTPNQTVHLHWQTASERNSSFFAIERSADGKVFEEIDQVDAAGNSSQTLTYETFDKQPLAGISYYRLRIVDNDGTYEYSSVVSVRSDNTKNDAETFELYPNPTQNGLVYIKYKGNSSNVKSVELHSALGKTLQKHEMDAKAFIPQINLEGNAKGVYWVVIHSIDGSKQVQKLVYQ